jgi:hypothetical protein
MRRRDVDHRATPAANQPRGELTTDPAPTPDPSPAPGRLSMARNLADPAIEAAFRALVCERL